MANYIYCNGELYHAADKNKQHKYIKKVKVNGKWKYYYKDKLFKVSMHFIPMQHNPDAYTKAVENNIKYF